MGRRVFTVPTWSAVAVADGTNMIDQQHISLQGGVAGQSTFLLEVFCGGLATSSAPSIMQLARHSVVGATLTALAAPNSDIPLNASMSALSSPPLAFWASTTKPQASGTNKLGSYAFNLFGGLIRKQWNPGEGPSILGNTASLGEVGLNAFTGSTTGSLGTHIEYETV